MTFKREFPDFDGHMPTLNGFTDCSWHNDVCPSQMRILPDGRQVSIWFSYIEPDKKGFPEMSAYAVALSDADGVHVEELMDSNDLQEVVDFLTDYCGDSEPVCSREDIGQSYLKTGFREHAIRWLERHDPDGDYSDRRIEAQGGVPHEMEDLRALIKSALGE